MNQAPARTIDGDLWHDADLNHRQKYLMAGIIHRVCDDQGRTTDELHRFKALLFSTEDEITEAIIEGDLQQLTLLNWIFRYQDKTGWRLIQVVDWWTTQHRMHHAARSPFPPPAHWRDRINTHEPGHGKEGVQENWDKEHGPEAGGFDARYLTTLRKRATQRRKGQAEGSRSPSSDYGGHIPRAAKKKKKKNRI